MRTTSAFFRTFLFVFLFVPFLSCDNQGKASGESNNEHEQTETPAAEKMIGVTYENATVYAGRTDYAFTNDAGEQIMVGVSNFDEDEDDIEVPDDMLESDAELEGPPGPNPELVGKRFVLVYGEDGEVVAIRKM